MWNFFGLFSGRKGVDRKGIPNNYPKKQVPLLNEKKTMTKFSEGKGGSNNVSESNWVRNTIIADALLSTPDNEPNVVNKEICSVTPNVVSTSTQSVASSYHSSSKSSCRSRDNDDDDDDGGGSGGGSDDWDDD